MKKVLVMIGLLAIIFFAIITFGPRLDANKEKVEDPGMASVLFIAEMAAYAGDFSRISSQYAPSDPAFQKEKQKIVEELRGIKMPQNIPNDLKSELENYRFLAIELINARSTVSPNGAEINKFAGNLKVKGEKINDMIENLY